ncbi:hypothetical protein [Modestobacter sp. VKM Ac-2980]|uniref:hypothetical protein n=1 Tax=unclassified Modestobacter TaxID=2643866 RepID=UPI003FA57283
MGSWSDPTHGKIWFAAYAEQWVVVRRVKGRPLADSTKAPYRHQLTRHVLPTLDRLELRKITRRHVRTWHAKLTGPDDAGVIGAPRCSGWCAASWRRLWRMS